MRRPEPPFRVVGHANKAHGTKGELFVWPLTDHPERSFAPGVVLYLADEEGERPDPSLGVLTVESVRPFRRGFLVRAREVSDRTEAEGLTGRYLLRPAEELAGLEEGEVFYHQLLGMRVLTVEGREVGEIVEVYELRPADLLEVREEGHTRLIPFLASLVKRVDPSEGIMVIDPPEGLLEL